MRRNSYDAQTGTLTLSADRVKAIHEVADHYIKLFGADPGFDKLRDQYAMALNSLPEASDREALSAFFFWSSWAAATDRPGF